MFSIYFANFIAMFLRSSIDWRLDVIQIFLIIVLFTYFSQFQQNLVTWPINRRSYTKWIFLTIGLFGYWSTLQQSSQIDLSIGITCKVNAYNNSSVRIFFPLQKTTCEVILWLKITHQINISHDIFIRLHYSLRCRHRKMVSYWQIAYFLTTF